MFQFDILNLKNEDNPYLKIYSEAKIIFPRFCFLANVKMEMYSSM